MKRIVYLVRYIKLLLRVDRMKIYDGRGQGVDIYKCEQCGAIIYTKYRDKGVTPAGIGCTECIGRMHHTYTIPEYRVPAAHRVFEWYRPSFREMMTLSPCAVEHVLNGGLISNIRRNHGTEQ